MLSRRRARGAVLAGAALLVGGCRGAEPLVVVHDLARLAPAADFEGGLEYLAFGTVITGAASVNGVVNPLEAHEERFAWLRPRTELRLRSAPGAARRLVLDLEPRPDAARASLRVLWNLRKCGRVELARERRRYVFDLPAAPAGSGGTNRLELRFSGAARHVPGYRGRLAARLFGLWSGAAHEPALAPERIASSIAPLAVRLSGVPEVVLSPGRLRFALRLPERAQLRFGARLIEGQAAELRVTLEERLGEERELWRGTPSGGEVSVPLRSQAGSVVRLALHVAAASNSARVAWSAPRVLGTGPLGAPSSHSATEEAIGDRVRAALRGASVVLVILDAAGARHFGALGGPKQATPEFDRLAKDGVVFENAFTPAVYTFAAMSSLFTSMPPDEHGNVDSRMDTLSRAPIVVAEAAASRGIHTAAVVASPVVGPRTGFDRGFAEFHAVYADYDGPTEAEALRPQIDRVLAASAERSFFAWVHYREPHAPYDPKPPYDRLFGAGPIPKELRAWDLLKAIRAGRYHATPDEIDHLRRLYLGNLAYVDHEVGWLRGRLEAAGLLERTVLIVTADHGEAFWEHKVLGHNLSVYDEVARVPLLIRFPKAAGLAGRRVSSLVELSDLAPTIADALGFWREARPAFQGLSLLPVAAGARGRSAVVTRDSASPPTYALRDERSTCILNTADDSVQRYDRASDPTEQRNVAADEPLAADACRQSVRAWILDRRLGGKLSEAQPLSAVDRERLRALGYVE